METKIFLILVIVIGLFQNCHAQSEKLNDLESSNKNAQFDLSKALISEIDTLELSNANKARYYYESAITASNTSTDLVQPYQLLLKAKDKVPKDSLNFRFKINDELIYTYLSSVENALPFDDLVSENCQIAQLTQDPKMLVNCNFYQVYYEDYESETSINRSLRLLRESKKIAQNNNLSKLVKTIELNLGIVHDLANHSDSALHYFNVLIPYYKQIEDFETLKDLYNSKGITLKKSKQYKEAIFYFKKALEEHYPIENQENMLMVTRNLADAYYLNKNYKLSATLYRNKIRISDSLKTIDAARSLEELETKFKTAEKEKENLQLQADKKNQRTQIYLLLGSVIFLALLGLFFYNNQRKKKLLAQKEQELEKQRADTILKNQELATIDAMISGQEKERKRLAEELHDNLGSSLTTVKLYFENLKSNVKDEQGLEVYHRTEQILDDTYETIRTMSHNRNNGVLASKGLIPSLQTLADKITSSNKLTVELIHHGLDKKLENSIELIIFRTIQELLNNIIKHAHATHATINLTSYDENLNIMVEDNGKGFNATVLPETEGMGLSNIEKRIENLDGTFEIDSHPGRGTTINIDIPYYDQTNYS